MRKTFALFVAVVAIIIACGAYLYAVAVKTRQNSKACTMEVKLCFDGSYVGRTGPNCEFTDCPASPPAPSTGAGNSIGTSAILKYDSGVNGTVTMGPTCPVVRIPPDPNCADKPYQTRVTIFRASDPARAYIVVNSDATGAFSAPLPPGEYILSAGEKILPRCDSPRVTVKPHALVSTTITCDTGIR